MLIPIVLVIVVIGIVAFLVVSAKKKSSGEDIGGR